MATPGVGQDIEALCGRCGQVWHVVMAKMGDKIAKVVCKRCGGHHRYRDENACRAAAAAARRRRGRRAAAAHVRIGAAVVASRARRRRPPCRRSIRPSRRARYAPRDSYVAGERVAHPTFGVGVVAGSPGAGKVDVVFGSGARVLACAKVTSTLARPVAHAGSAPSRPPAEVTDAGCPGVSCASASSARSAAGIPGSIATRSPARRGWPTARSCW